jgi:hypothetical protein
MRTRPGSEVINQDRRQLLSTAAMGIAAVGAASFFSAYPAPAATSDEIRPFLVNVPEEALVDLRRRINATRWPDRETVTDESQGVQLATIQEVARYWGTDYDWRKCEAKLNALPQFMTEIDGLDIHFIHVRSKHENAMPLIVTHSWPGSVIEQLKIIDPLTNPTAHGASARIKASRDARWLDHRAVHQWRESRAGSRPRSLRRRIDQRSWLPRMTSFNAERAFNCLSGTQARIALRSWMPGSSTIHANRLSPASLAAIWSGMGSISFDTVTFITMRPPGASRARIASQVSRSNSSLNSKPGPPTSIAMPS